MLIFRSDYVFDERLVRALVDTPASDNSILVAPASQDVAAASVEAGNRNEALALFTDPESLEKVTFQTNLRVITPTDLVLAYNATLRKSDPPYLLPIQPERIEEIESRIFNASYKGITDLVTKMGLATSGSGRCASLGRCGSAAKYSDCPELAAGNPGDLVVCLWLLCLRTGSCLVDDLSGYGRWQAGTGHLNVE